MKKNCIFFSWNKPFFVFTLFFTLHSTLLALNAPYIISADALNESNIVFTWRNNDLTANKVIVFRKSGSSSWQAIDTAIASSAKYTDSDLSPATTYDYALKAYREPDSVSELSNTVSVATPISEIRMDVPDVFLNWDRNAESIFISFIDSANIEEGFRIFRREVGMNWQCIDTMITTTPAYMGLRNDTDKAVAPNTWYEYKVEAYKDTVSKFSPEKYTYSYQRPEHKIGYAIHKLASFPINLFDWVEKLGDSVYVQELLPNGDTAIAVIDVSEASHPVFKSYLKLDNLPINLKGTIIDAYISFGARSNNELLRAGNYYLVSQGGNLCFYNAPYRDSEMVEKNCITYDCSLKEMINDSCAIVYKGSGLTAIQLNSSGIDTLGKIASYGSGGAAGHAWGNYYWGICNGNAVTMIYSYSTSRINCTIYTYSVQRIPDSEGGKQYEYSEEVGSEERFSGKMTNVIDKSIVFNYQYLGGNEGKIFALDISDDRSGPLFNLGSYVDSFNYRNFRHSVVDSTKKQIFFFYDSAMSIYGYEKTAIKTLRSMKAIKYSGILRTVLKRNGPVVFIADKDQKNILYAAVCDIFGRRMSTIFFNSEGRAIWNRTDMGGKQVAPGCYVLVISQNPRMIAKKFILQ